jgi:lipid-A-disaccharide synthase
MIAKRLLKLRFVSLPNILLGREVQPERLQWDCTPEALAEALRPLLADPEARARQQDGYREAVRLLTPPDGATPSGRAAETILALASQGAAAALKPPR